MQAGEWTARTLHVWIFYGIVAVVVLSTELSFHWISAFLASDLSHIISTYFFLLMFCVEPIALLFSTLTIGRYPEELSNSPETAAARISKNSEACVVIPCHNSQDIIAATINACLNHFNENQIFVVDNGNSPGPTDQTKQVLHGLAPSAHYVSSSCSFISPIALSTIISVSDENVLHPFARYYISRPICMECIDLEPCG